MHDFEQRRMRLMIGRSASLHGPPPDLSAWVAERERELFILPVLPDDALSDSVRTASLEGYRRSALVTVWGEANSDTTGIRLVWLAVETTIEAYAGGGAHLPIASATTVADMLRILQPGASMTLRLDANELTLRPDAFSQPIVEEQDVNYLSELMTIGTP